MTRTYRAATYAAVCCAVALLAVRRAMRRPEPALGRPGPELVTFASDGYIVPMAATNPNAATYLYNARTDGRHQQLQLGEVRP